MKRALLHTFKMLGFFALSRLLTGRGLRILCYHGFSARDEHAFRPIMAMRRETFRERMLTLERLNYPVLRLDEALTNLNEGTLPSAAVVITFDDGWYSFRRDAFSTLQTLGFPATIYVSSYYAEHETAVFNLLVEYLFWRTEATSVALPGRDREIAGPFNLTTAAERKAAAEAVISHGDQHCDAERRQALADDLARALGFDPVALRQERVFHLLNRSEIAACAEAGIDIQLQGHRHLLSVDDEVALAREIDDNRDALEPLTRNTELSHLCYPGGFYDQRQWPWLKAHGVHSAVTTLKGLNNKETPRLALRRYVDREDNSAIEFEAEISGFMQIVRALTWRKPVGVKVDYCASQPDMSRSRSTPSRSISGSNSDVRLRRKVESRRGLFLATLLRDTKRQRSQG